MLKNLGKVGDSLKAKVADPVSQAIPHTLKATLKLRTLGALKIPLLFFVSPSVVELTEKRCVVKIPLTRRTKNHLGSMYFGALSIGADCAGGLIAWELAEKSGHKISLVFKDFRAEFLKRPEGDVHFTCNDGEKIAEFVETVAGSDERANMPVEIVATVPSKLGDDPVARFTLTLSLKKKSS